MKGKVMIHYSVSFIIACLVILFINIFFMRISIYQAGALYNYHPETMVAAFEEYIYLSGDGKVSVTEEGKLLLESERMGLQILDAQNQEVFSYNKPEIAMNEYSNVALVDLYTREDTTLFLNEKNRSYNLYLFNVFRFGESKAGQL